MANREELVSVIITNFNYGRYLKDAIESALKLDWGRKEVIVVDDGSTDNSRTIIETYKTKGIISMFIDNVGQAPAAEKAFYFSSGNWILFLDSDDVVEPNLIKEAQKVMIDGWSMIQCSMRVIDKNGTKIDRIFPKYYKHTTPNKITEWMKNADCYPAAPTSGNLLSRRFLEKIFPLEKGMDHAIDSYFLSTAPFFGSVITVRKPLVRYRLHGDNDGAQNTLCLSRIARDLRRHKARCDYATRIAKTHGMVLSSDRWKYGFYNIAMRATSISLNYKGHPYENDSITNCLKDSVLALTTAQGLSVWLRVAMFMWVLAVLVGPKSVKHSLASWRFAPDTRPKLIQYIFTKS